MHGFGFENKAGMIRSLKLAYESFFFSKGILFEEKSCFFVSLMCKKMN